MKQVLCEIGDNTYGIDIEYVQGIEKQLDFVPESEENPGYLFGEKGHLPGAVQQKPWRSAPADGYARRGIM